MFIDSQLLVFGGFITFGAGAVLDLAPQESSLLSLTYADGLNNLSFVWNWTATALPMTSGLRPLTRYSHAAAVTYRSLDKQFLDDHNPLMIIHGGLGYSDTGVWGVLSDCWVYEVKARSWMKLEAVKLALAEHSIVGMASKVFIYGGRTTVTPPVECAMLRQNCVSRQPHHIDMWHPELGAVSLEGECSDNDCGNDPMLYGHTMSLYQDDVISEFVIV